MQSSHLMWLTESVLFFCVLSPSMRAQTSDAQTTESKSWTAVTESHTADANPTRTTESYSQSGKDSVDRQSVERLGTDGHFEPYFDIEKESVQVNDTTIRTVERTFARDGNGQKILKQVTEEERRRLPEGEESVVRTTSNADLDGHLQVMQREVADTKKISPDLQEKKTTIFLSDGQGGMAPSVQIQESEKRGADHTVEVQESKRVLDGAGNWQVQEQKKSTTKQTADERTTEEQLWRPDADGKLALVSRTLGKNSESAGGEKLNSVETYSADILGSAPDGKLHLSQRVTVKHASTDGKQTTEEQLQQLNPGDPDAGLRVTTETRETVQPNSSGTSETRTIEVRNASGSFEVVSFDTQKSDNVHAMNVAIAP